MAQEDMQHFDVFLKSRSFSRYQNEEKQNPKRLKSDKDSFVFDEIEQVIINKILESLFENHIVISEIDATKLYIAANILQCENLIEQCVCFFMDIAKINPSLACEMSSSHGGEVPDCVLKTCMNYLWYAELNESLKKFLSRSDVLKNKNDIIIAGAAQFVNRQSTLINELDADMISLLATKCISTFDIIDRTKTVLSSFEHHCEDSLWSNAINKAFVHRQCLEARQRGHQSSSIEVPFQKCFINYEPEHYNCAFPEPLFCFKCVEKTILSDVAHSLRLSKLPDKKTFLPAVFGFLAFMVDDQSNMTRKLIFIKREDGMRSVDILYEENLLDSCVLLLQILDDFILQDGIQRRLSDEYTALP